MEEAYRKAADILGLSIEEVRRIYKAYWFFIRKRITALPLKTDMDEETFNTLKTNVNIPSLGKLNCSYDRYLSVLKRYKGKENEKTS